MSSLNNKNILLGVTGSIAAYKAPDIVRRLQELGTNVRVVITQSGEQFITKLSLQTVSGHEVYSNLWNEASDSSITHIELAKWADCILVAPASANTIANIATGTAQNLLENIILANSGMLFIAPAMNKQMLTSSVMQDNITKIKHHGGIIINSDSGSQACGDIGIGRLAEATNIAKQISQNFISTALSGKKVLITLGATIEKIDPVRYISNFSSGKMGMAMVDICIEMGASVVCVYADITTTLNPKANNIEAINANDMHKEVMNNINKCDIFISCAAVADYSPKNISTNKIKKTNDNLIIELTPNKDILKNVSKLKNKPICIGFAAETQDLVKNAQKKLKNKSCDVIILNDVSSDDFGFKSDENEVFFITDKKTKKIAKNSKFKIAKNLMQLIIKEFLK